MTGLVCSPAQALYPRKVRRSHPMSFFVSAPGKAILFGEHLAVYGKPAIAAALSLRAYLLVEPSNDPALLELYFPDLDIADKWAIDDLPWAQVLPHVGSDEAGRPLPTADLVPEILAALEGPLRSCTPGLHYSACRCFLYMFMSMCTADTRGCRFSIRSTLPVGAGLGSSAAVSVCLSAGMALAGGHVARPSGPGAGSAPAFINLWAFMGEKCFHGNPSGIDNAVATYGGAVLYQRTAAAGAQLDLCQLPELALLLTNTKVPRSTATLVGNVADTNRQHPEICGNILEAMGRIVQDAHALMQSRPVDRARLRQLVGLNHGLLVALGVSHPSLEQVRIIADRAGVGATKLTGAGGGGCALTVLEDGISQSAVEAVCREFAQVGMDTYLTALGGSGVGVLDPTDATKQYFSLLAVAQLLTRDAIEAALGAANVPEWEYW